MSSDEVMPILEPEIVTAARVSDRILELASAGFDASAEVPIRCAVLRVDGGDERRHVLVIVVHHIVADGFSMNPPSQRTWQRLTRPAVPAVRRTGRNWPCSTATSLCGSTKCSAPRKIRTRL